MSVVRVASVQAPVVFGDPTANAAYAVARLEELAVRGVQLAVFPEAFLTGYCVTDAEEARAIALPIRLEGDEIVEAPESVQSIREAAQRLGVHAVFGFAGVDARGVINVAALVEPSGRLRAYLKTHLPELGLDKHVVPGDSLPVFDTEIGRIGILICFDLRPPEPMRCLAIQGADLIALPTNWPVGAEMSAELLSRARALESRVHFVACDRIGEERGFRFIGMSSIVDATGTVLALAGAEAEVLVADLDLAVAREKRIRTIPGQYEWTVFESRRPDLYGALLRNDPSGVEAR